MSLVQDKILVQTSNGLYKLEENPLFVEYIIKQVTRWRNTGDRDNYFSRFENLDQEKKDEYIRIMVKNRDMFYEIWKKQQNDDFIHMVKNDVPSRILRHILGINYMYTVVDDLKDTPLYKQSFKQLLNRLEKELDMYMKDSIIKRFYSQADSEDYMNNLDIMEKFFKEMSRLHTADLQATMLNFIEEMQKIKTDVEYAYKKD